MLNTESTFFTPRGESGTGKELADNGTILLDEIGDMPLTLQVKLLRVLQEHEIEPIGGQRPIRINVRIMCSTAMDLSHAVETGVFRKDLYYRLKVIPIELPALKDHKEDIPELCDHFFLEFGKMHDTNMSLSAEALDMMMKYDYLGNIRELRNIIERISVLSKGPIIFPADLPIDISGSVLDTCEDTVNLAQNLYRVEQMCIKKALLKSNGNKTEAAKLLGISRKNLWEKMKQFKQH